MGRTQETLTPALAAFVSSQPVFFVATAPLAADGHVNVSPKGRDTFRVLDDRTVAYLDLTGSGVETIAHLRENGRITLMFCAFEGAPQIVRLQGRGEALRPGDDGFDDLVARFPSLPGLRSVIRVVVDRVASSCGYGVPLMTYQSDRDRLLEWAEAKGPDGIERYWQDRNAVSVDGLPGI